MCAYIDFGVDFYLTTHISFGPLATNRERNRIERAKTPRFNKSAHLYYRRELRGNMRALNLAATAPHAITRHRIIFIRSARFQLNRMRTITTTTTQRVVQLC